MAVHNRTKPPESPIETSGNPEETKNRHYCQLLPMAMQELPSGLSPFRTSAIIPWREKWVNGTTLRYYFFDKDTDGEEVRYQDVSVKWVTWIGDDAERQVVRQAFKEWEAVGIGLKFEEVQDRADAEIRIGFMQGNGSWSGVGRQILRFQANERTMNFGWPLKDDLDTAIHEIGHTLGMQHEHQNPYAGIVWDEEAVYAALAAPPNGWDREKTRYNIIRKILPGEVQGSSWDPDSVMHYPFEPGLILSPEQYRDHGLKPSGGISERDRVWVQLYYPPRAASDMTEIKANDSVALDIAPGGQRDFEFKPKRTGYFEMRTFGESDSVVVLFESVDGQLRYLSGDDDSGEERNAHIRVKLRRGRKYVIRVRLYFDSGSGDTSFMIW